MACLTQGRPVDWLNGAGTIASGDTISIPANTQRPARQGGVGRGRSRRLTGRAAVPGLATASWVAGALGLLGAILAGERGIVAPPSALLALGLVAAIVAGIGRDLLAARGGRYAARLRVFAAECVVVLGREAEH